MRVDGGGEGEGEGGRNGFTCTARVFLTGLADLDVGASGCGGWCLDGEGGETLVRFACAWVAGRVLL